MTVENEKKTYIGDRYYYDQNGKLYYETTIRDKKTNEPKRVEPTLISNHTPVLMELCLIVDGVNPEIEQYTIKPFKDGKYGRKITVTRKEIDNKTAHIKLDASYIIEMGRGCKSHYYRVIEMQGTKVNQTIVYKRTGYKIIDDKRVFLNGDNSITVDGMTDKYKVILDDKLARYRFTAEKHEDRFRTLLELLPKVAPEDVIFTGLAFSFLTALNGLLREIDIEPRFVLYFAGKTSSRKSTMADLFLNFFGTFPSGITPPASYTDTLNSIGQKLAITDSTLLLLDDRAPSTDAKTKTQMENVEQIVLRWIGERTGRSRLDAESNAKTTHIPKCNVITTAEESFLNVGESAIARAISVEIKNGDVNMDKLTEVQDKALHLNECMADYIQYVLQNWDELKATLKPLFRDYRAKAQNGGHGRLAETAAYLQIGIYVMCKWLKTVGVIDDPQAEKMNVKARSIFMKLADDQNRRIKDEQPTKLFLQAIRDMRDQGVIRFEPVETTAPIERIKANCHAELVVYHDADKGFYYFNRSGMYTLVRKHYDAKGQVFPVSERNIYKQLALENIIEPGKNQVTKNATIKSIKPGLTKVIYLKCSALYDEEVDS